MKLGTQVAASLWKLWSPTAMTNLEFIALLISSVLFTILVASTIDWRD